MDLRFASGTLQIGWSHCEGFTLLQPRTVRNMPTDERADLVEAQIQAARMRGDLITYLVMAGPSIWTIYQALRRSSGSKHYC